MKERVEYDWERDLETITRVFNNAKARVMLSVDPTTVHFPESEAYEELCKFYDPDDAEYVLDTLFDEMLKLPDPDLNQK